MNRTSPPISRPHGFSLVELLVVITIISVLPALSFGAYRNVQASGRSASCASNLHGIGAAFALYAGAPPISRPHGFSLVELLVVITIISVLAALSFGAYRNVQASGRSASCASNLHGIGAAFALYAGENDGVLPALRYRADLGGENPSKKNWQFEINPYLEVNGGSFKTIATGSGGGKQIFCPEYIREYADSKDAQKLVSGGFGMNPNLGGSQNAYDHRNPLSSIPAHSLTILAGDSDDYHLAVVKGTWPEKPTPGQRFGSGDPVRHGKVANYLFVDGHIAALSQKDAEAMLLKVQTN